MGWEKPPQELAVGGTQCSSVCLALSGPQVRAQHTARKEQGTTLKNAKSLQGRSRKCNAFHEEALGFLIQTSPHLMGLRRLYRAYRCPGIAVHTLLVVKSGV